jgi:hypothetical protein
MGAYSHLMEDIKVLVHVRDPVALTMLYSSISGWYNQFPRAVYRIRYSMVRVLLSLAKTNYSSVLYYSQRHTLKQANVGACVTEVRWLG